MEQPRPESNPETPPLPAQAGASFLPPQVPPKFEGSLQFGVQFAEPAERRRSSDGVTKTEQRVPMTEYGVTIRLDTYGPPTELFKILPDGTVKLGEGVDPKSIREALQKCQSVTSAHSVLFALAFHEIARLTNRVLELERAQTRRIGE